MAIALRDGSTERQSLAINLCTAAELHRLRYDQLSPTQARQIHSLMHQLGSYAESMDFPADFARLFATLHHVLVAMASHTQTDPVAVVEGELADQALPAAQTAVLEGEIMALKDETLSQTQFQLQIRPRRISARN